MDIKLSKAQFIKIFQSGGFLGKTLCKIIGNLGKKTLLEFAVPLAVDVLSKLANKATLSILGKVEKNICGKGFLRARKGFTLFTSNEGLNDIVKIVKSLEKSGLLINGPTETVKHEIKNHKGGFFGAMMVPMATSLIAPKAFSLIQPLNKPAPSLIDLNSVELNYYSFMISCKCKWKL